MIDDAAEAYAEAVQSASADAPLLDTTNGGRCERLERGQFDASRDGYTIMSSRRHAKASFRFPVALAKMQIDPAGFGAGEDATRTDRPPGMYTLSREIRKVGEKVQRNECKWGLPMEMAGATN